MKIGFIGCGNMASAIIKGIIESKAVSADDVYAYDVSPAATENAAARYGITVCADANELTDICDYVVLAVKPNALVSVLNKINIKLREKNAVLISIAAGKTISFIRETLSQENKIVRVMPNINAKVGAACCAYCANSLVTQSEKKKIEKIFGAIGEISELSESSFPIFGVIAGCGPAFAYMFTDALARAGVKNGLSKDTALKIAAQTVAGSAKMILESGAHPFELIDSVCSPGGTTIEGIASLQADGFESAVHKAVDRALDKDKKL